MDNSFHYLSMANHSMFQKKLLAALKDTGLTMGQPKILDYLKDHDGAGQKEIAAGCHIEAPSLTSVLSRMEEKGLIERRMLNGNRRSLHVFITHKGREYLPVMESAFAELESRAFQGISKKDRDSFMETFARIYENLEK